MEMISLTLRLWTIIRKSVYTEIKSERKVYLWNILQLLQYVKYYEYMEPLGISAYRLAQAINVPLSRVQDILHDRRKITADTSLRLAKFFGVSDRYFLDLQNDIDIRNLKIQLANEISKIPVCQVG